MSTSTAASTAALPYQEPSILVILIISSFLFVTNVVGAVLDRLLFCGLVGQIFIGITWGTPGGQLLSESTQKILGTQGYLGLIGLIYEGATVRVPCMIQLSGHYQMGYSLCDIHQCGGHAANMRTPLSLL